MYIARSFLAALAALLILGGAGSALATSALDIDFLGIGDIAPSVNGVTSYQHVFDPVVPLDEVTVESAWLFVGLVQWPCDSGSGCGDDLLFETSGSDDDMIALDLMPLLSLEATSAVLKVLWGDVTTELEADLVANNGILDVTVSSPDGEFVVFGSKLATKYSYGVNAIPEPSAALVFAFGMLIVTRGTGRSRR